jgi:hypothetical protein
MSLVETIHISHNADAPIIRLFVVVVVLLTGLKSGLTKLVEPTVLKVGKISLAKRH